jgi:hypothetical protein
MQVPPHYVGLANTEVFTAMVRYWTSKAFKKKHDHGVKCRAAMKGGCHRQGSLHLPGHIQNEVVLMFDKCKQINTDANSSKSLMFQCVDGFLCTSYYANKIFQKNV